MNPPTIREALDHLSEHYGLTAAQVRELVRTPLHPRELRDEFAGRAMQTLVGQGWPDAGRMAEEVYKVADAMLAARLPKET
jgi:hypothetical protein